MSISPKPASLADAQDIFTLFSASISELEAPQGQGAGCGSLLWGEDLGQTLARRRRSVTMESKTGGGGTDALRGLPLDHELL